MKGGTSEEKGSVAWLVASEACLNPGIPNPTKCEVQALIQYLTIAENEMPINIHCKIGSVYGDMMSHDEITEFKDGRRNIHNE